MPTLIISVGQAGNQVGKAIWSLLIEVSASDPSLKSEYFHNDGTCRAILVDTEPKVVNAVAKDPVIGKYFRPANLLTEQSGRGNNWAMGFYGPSRRRGPPAAGCPDSPQRPRWVGNTRDGVEALAPRALVDATLARVAHEQRDSPSGIDVLLIHSLGGGTGSGLGTRLIFELRRQRVSVVAVTILPSRMSDAPVQWLNVTFALHILIRDAAAVLAFENDIVATRLRKGKQQPSLANINAHIAWCVYSVLRSCGSASGGVAAILCDVAPLSTVAHLEALDLTPSPHASAAPARSAAATRALRAAGPSILGGAVRRPAPPPGLDDQPIIASGAVDLAAPHTAGGRTKLLTIAISPVLPEKSTGLGWSWRSHASAVASDPAVAGGTALFTRIHFHAPLRDAGRCRAIIRAAAAARPPLTLRLLHEYEACGGHGSDADPAVGWEVGALRPRSGRRRGGASGDSSIAAKDTKVLYGPPGDKLRVVERVIAAAVVGAEEAPSHKAREPGTRSKPRTKTGLVSGPKRADAAANGAWAGSSQDALTTDEGVGWAAVMQARSLRPCVGPAAEIAVSDGEDRPCVVALVNTTSPCVFLSHVGYKAWLLSEAGAYVRWFEEHGAGKGALADALRELEALLRAYDILARDGPVAPAGDGAGAFVCDDGSRS